MEPTAGFFFILATICSVLIIFSSVRFILRYLKWKKTDGVVEHVETVPLGDIYDDRLTVRYVIDGVTYEFKLPTGSTYDNKSVGDPIRILYDPSNPLHCDLYDFGAKVIIPICGLSILIYINVSIIIGWTKHVR